MKANKIILALTFLITAFANITGLHAQNDQKAFFIYRNDGDFNAFFFSEVDSIVYSRIDVDSIVRDNFVTQEVWTADTTVRIPIENIDSIGFQTPSNIYKNGVVVLDAERQSWISKADSLTLYYSTATPAAMLPAVGERLVTTDMNALFPVGFIGKVKSLSHNTDYIVVDCDQINISDAFDRYYCVIEGECEETPDGRMRMARTREDETIELPAITFEGDFNLSANWSPSEYSNLGAGANLSVSSETKPTLHYVYANEYGDQFFSLRIDFDHTVTYGCSLYGQFSVEKDWDLAKVEKIIEAVPFTKIYLKGGPRVELSGNVALEDQFSETYHSTYFYSRGTNPNVKYRNYFTGIKRTGGQQDIKTLMGSISLYGGVFTEVGYGLLIDDWGKVYGRVDAGLELTLEADLLKSIDNAPYSTELYDSTEDLVTLDLDFVRGASCGVGVGIGDIGYNESIDAMFKVNIFSWGLFPSFEDMKYIKEDDGNSYLVCGIGKDVIGSIPVGFKVFDDKDNEIFCQYNDVDYSSSAFNEYKIPFNEAKIGEKYTAYPVFKFLGKYDILASPSTDITLSVTPVTGGSANIEENSATVSGHLEGDTDNLQDGYTCGFMYSESANPSTNGITVYCNAGDGFSLTSTLTGLKDNTVYYYCTFVCIDETYYYGETNSFKTKEKEDEIVDLGLSVKWRGWNLGATVPEGYGDYYAWGETETKAMYSWDTYFDNPYGSDGSWVGSQTNSDISGTELDAATATLGPEWRMPTRDEMQELIDGCDWNWTQVNGVWGYEVASRTNENSIFLPAAGNYDSSSVNNAGQYGGYWTGTVGTSTSNSQAGNLYFFGKTLHAVQWSNRYMGRSIRPVTEQ